MQPSLVLNPQYILSFMFLAQKVLEEQNINPATLFSPHESVQS